MGKVVLEMTMSLDGYIAGVGDDVARLHRWMLDGTSSQRLGQYEGSSAGGPAGSDMLSASGAIVMGKRTFTIGQRPWGDTPPFHMPCFVLTNDAREPMTVGDTTYTFVTDGIEVALERARSAAGEKSVTVMGGANVAQQCVRGGHLDEMVIHVAPMILGGGIRLFDHVGARLVELEATSVDDAPGVTHIRYRVRT